MRPATVFTIYRKELREALRDRRTIFMMIGLPILLYPLLMIGLSRLQEGQEAAQAARASRVAVWGTLPLDAQERMLKSGKIELLPWAGASDLVRAGLEMDQLKPPPRPPIDLEGDDKPPVPKKMPDAIWARAAQQAILDRKADAILIAWPDFGIKLQRGDMAVASILYDSVRPDSRKARDRISDHLRQYRLDLLAVRETQNKLPDGFATGIDIQNTNVASEQRKSGMLVGMLLPYMLILFSAMSGFYAAIDMTAGEKERGTMQTLLCAPVESLEIIGGKFLAVWSIAMIATVVNLLSLSLTFTRLKLIPGIQTSVPVTSYLIAFVMLVPISLMINAVFLAVGAFAKDFKDGQNFLTPILMSLLVPLVATMTPGIELNGYLAFVPVVNIALLIKGVFLGEWAADTLFLVMLSSLCYASIALVFAAHIFERNSLLLGGKEHLSGVFDFSRHPGARPTPAVSMLVFAVALVMAFYGSLSLTRYGLPTVLIVMQFGFFLLPCLALVRLKGYDFVETFSLRLPSLRASAACILIGLSAWTVAGGLLVRLLPPPESLQKAMERLLLLDDKPAPLWQALVLVGLIPALCEEALFRGLILSGFRRLGMWPAILATSLLFGLAHASIYRLLPTFALGVAFGYAVWKTRSLAAGIICHALNNGLMAVLARSKDIIEELGLSGSKYIPWTIIGAGCVVMVLGLWLLSQDRDAARTDPI
ncbi:ABC transporter permease subunit/CPBP intramembrane protease [Paludibaculum fermentans]|uniref:ABC transporter permease subunit/CPBP intramembrane protease n=1 Tax=Paludibaculum fermentans TaxID=1473598 RepID=UPI003EBE1B70